MRKKIDQAERIAVLRAAMRGEHDAQQALLDYFDDYMLSILASFAQEESLSVSENCKWRIRNDFKLGKPTTTRLNGLRIDHGTVTVIPEEAEVISLIFELRLAGIGKNGISRELNRRGIPAKNGGIWHDSVVETILKNEKYQGDLLLQKQYRVDHLNKID